MEQYMRFPSLSDIIKLSTIFLFTSNKLFVTANHRSHTAPGADDPDSGRGLSKEPSMLLFNGESQELRDKVKEYEGEDNRPRLRLRS